MSWLVFAGVAGWAIAHGTLWIGLLVTFLFAVPVYVAAIYAVSIRKIYRSSQFNHKGFLYWFATGRVWAFAWRALWSLGFAFLMLLFLAGASVWQWFAVLLAVPVLPVIYERFRTLSAREFKPYIAVQKALELSRWTSAAGMAALYVLTVWIANAAGGDSFEPVTVAAAMQATTLPAGFSQSSALLTEAARLVAWYQGIQFYALNNLQRLDAWLWLFAAYAGALAFFYNLALGFSGFMVPAAEYRRIAAPLDAADQPPPLRTEALLIGIALVTLFSGFIYVPFAAYLEHWLRTNPAAVHWLHASEAAVVEKLEQIDSHFYRLGTVAQIDQAKIALLADIDLSLASLRREIDAGFDQMIANVDAYLDWYYTLPGEYARIAALLTSSLEALMARELETHLMRGDAFVRLQQSLSDTLDKHEQLRTRYQATVAEILSRNRVIADANTASINYVNLDAVISPPAHAATFDLENRLVVAGGSAAAASAITVVIAKKVAAKVVAKGTVKLGATALAKVATAKASGALGGTAAGAAAGAAAGSVVPGVGTFAGAVVGGIVGAVVIGLTVDQLLLMLEESYSRDEFAQQIVDEIEASRAEFKLALGIGKPTSAAGVNRSR
jgi:hypothetical protein